MAMESITVQGWPLVEVCFQGEADQQQVENWLQQMDQLLQKQQPFGLLTRTSEQSDFSDLGRKAMGLWFKQQREQIGRWCVGVSRIALSDDAVERLAGVKMQAAMPCPIFASVSAQEAKAWLQQKLNSSEHDSVEQG